MECTFESYDASKKQCLDSLHMYQACSPDLKAIENHRLNNHVHEVEIGRDILKLSLEALSLDEGKRAIPFVKLGLEGLSHAKTSPCELHS